MEEQERREEGLKEEVPGIQVNLSFKYSDQSVMCKNRRHVLLWLLTPKRRGG